MKLLTAKEAAAYLNLSDATLAKWRCIGGGPTFIRYSARCIRYTQDALDAWLAQRIAVNTIQPHLRVVA